MNPHEYDLLDPDAPTFQMDETCLADKVWNLLWREGGFKTEWLTMYFSEDEEDVWDAVDQLLEEGRAQFTPAGRRLNPIWNFPDQRH
jgi:hypothetical protein